MVVESDRTCTVCGETKPLTDFYMASKWRRRYCKTCQKAKNWEYQVAHRPAVNRYKRLHKHGLTAERFDAILAAQGHRCAICRGDLSGRTHIDHDHACCPTGRGAYCGSCVRGVLCHRCNIGLAYVEDEAFASTARDYLSESSFMWKPTRP